MKRILDRITKIRVKLRLQYATTFIFSLVIVTVSILAINKIAASENKAEVAALANQTIIVLASLAGIMLIIGAWVAFSLSKNIGGNVQQISDRVVKLAEGKAPEKIETESADELGKSARALNELIDRIDAAATFAGKIGSGELNIQYDEDFKNDVLAMSLQNMHIKLKESAEDYRKRNWVTTGLANFSEILRTNDTDIKTLSQNIISSLVKYLKANQGQLFVVTSNHGEDDQLELMATYAWSKNKFISKTIHLGEGLTGQAWIEKNTIYLKEIPNDYIRITSGLGEALPNCVIIVPMKVNDEVFGIVEIGSFTEIAKHEVEFVEKLAELLASTLSSVRTNERTKQLLTESQQQAEEMRAQEEEMRQNMEELTATQEEMARKDREMSGQLMAINNSMATIEFSMDGVVLTANDKFLHVTGYVLNEVRGKHHRMFVEPAYGESEKYVKFWRDLNNGHAQTGEFHRLGKHNKEVWISASYTVMMNAQGTPVKVIKFATDVTEQKLKSLDFEGQINAVNNTMAAIEFRLDGTIVNANDMFLKTTGYAHNEVIGKHHKIFVDPVEAQGPSYQKFWNDLRDGKAQTGEFKRFGKDGSEIWISASYTPIRNASGVVYKVIKFAQNITEDKNRSVDYEGQIDAIRRSNAVIEFDLKGNILYANELFLAAMGFDDLSQVQNRHHSIFVSEFEMRSLEYKMFWDRLASGEFLTGEFQRKRADGRSIWINGSYNPILNADGRPYKVVKYAQVVKKDEEAVSVKATVVL